MRRFRIEYKRWTTTGPISIGFVITDNLREEYLKHGRRATWHFCKIEMNRIYKQRANGKWVNTRLIGE